MKLVADLCPAPLALDSAVCSPGPAASFPSVIQVRFLFYRTSYSTYSTVGRPHTPRLRDGQTQNGCLWHTAHMKEVTIAI